MTALRVTLRTGDEIYKALIQEVAEPGSTKYASTYAIQKNLDARAESIWSLFKHTLLSANDYFKKQMTICSYLEGIIHCHYVYPIFRSNMENDLAIYEKYAPESTIHNQLYKMYQYASEAAPYYTWAHCNSEDDSTDLSVGDLILPKDGRLYSSCFSLLPETERALALTHWAFGTKNANSMAEVAAHQAYHLKALLYPDEGNPIPPIPVNKNK